MRVVEAPNGYFLLYEVPSTIKDYLKNSVPIRHRDYLGEPHYYWRVHKTWIKPVTQLARRWKLSLELEVSEESRVIIQDELNQIRVNDKAPSKEQIYATLYLTTEAPSVIVDAVWKALVKIYHPDIVGGDATDFNKFKDAYDTIKKG